MNLRQIVVRLCFFFCFSIRIFAVGGALAESSTPLHVLRTEYFDIIFPEECRETANKIAAVCDDYYIEITALLETEPYQRFPVTITRSVEMLNAYYSALTYNRIVLYDTLPEESLNMYEKTIESIFYHELTHAVTYNIKGPVLKKLSFFADCLNPAWLTVTSFWAEGATVSFESKGRGGRLNDPFSTQIVSQAAIEGHFPSWRDVTGARDTYPGGTDAYIFGAMFASYLQETYGMSKYADFWKNAGSTLNPRFIASVFEKTYDNRSITEVWKEFEKTVLIDSSEKKADVISHKKSRIPSFDVYFDESDETTKIAYYDKASSSLRLVTLNKNGKIKKNKKLLAITGLVRVVFSSDGNFLALSRYIDKKNYKSVVAKYDIKKGKYIEEKETGNKDGFFTEDFALAKVKIYGSDDSFGIGSSVFDKEEMPFSPVRVDENLGAAIVKKGLDWKIRLFDSETALFDFDFPGKILHSLHFVKKNDSEIVLSFTWATLGMGGKMLSRAGFLRIDRETKNASVYYQKENSFAGVLETVPDLSRIDQDGKIVFYLTADEYEKTPLYIIEKELDDFECSEISPTFYQNENSSDLNIAETNPSDFNSLPPQELSYNPLRYYIHGIIAPIGFVNIYNHDLGNDAMGFWGVTFASANPWGDKQIVFSGGYNSSYKSGGMSLSFSGGDDSFTYKLEGTCIFDKEGFMQTVDTLQLTKILWRGKVSSFATGTQGTFLYGRQIIHEDFKDNTDDSDGRSADGLAFIQFSNIHKIAPGYYSKAGFTLKPFVLGSYRDSEKLPVEDKYLNAGGTLVLQFPIIVPFIFTANLFPSSKYVASGSVKAILLNFEIHKGIPAISLFAQRLVLSTTYSGKISYKHEEFWDCKRTDEILKDVKKNDYSDAVQVGLELFISPNTGFLATGDMQFALGYALIFRPNPKTNEKRLSYGITAKVNY